MKFSLALSSLLVSLSTVSANPLGTKADYSNLSFDLADCTDKTLIAALKGVFTAQGYTSGFNGDLRKLTSQASTSEAKDYLKYMCANALADSVTLAATPTTNWVDITDAEVDLGEYFDGDGFLNNETGNFYQDAGDLTADKYYYTGTDPRENDHYPTTEKSFAAGEAVDGFLDTAETMYLEDPTSFATCQHQAVMCCWHRDRQYKDNNGACAPNNCFDRDPGDNTDLCWTEDTNGNPTTYPGDDVEGNLHCHGFAWSTVLDDVNSKARWNNLFYVAMHDHMYTRGYVESITNDPNIANVQPMCGCIEEMSPVTRSDCSEAVPTTNYTLTTDANYVLSVDPAPGTYRMEFQACEGYIYDSSLGPAGYADALENGDELDDKDNDLSAFAYRLYLEQKMSNSTMFEIFKTLVGYEDPNTNNNDTACAIAFETKFENSVFQ